LDSILISQFDTKVDDENKVKKIIQGISQCTNTFKQLVNITKSKETNDVKTSSILNGKRFVSNFLKMTRFLSKYYPSYRSEITDILENLQKSIKTLQVLCNNAKTIKISSVTKVIPILKRDMEKIVYKTKIICKDQKVLKVKNWKKAELGSKEIYDHLVDSDKEMSDQEENQDEDEDDEDKNSTEQEIQEEEVREEEEEGEEEEIEEFDE
jgi:fanconi anemia group D2 protein